MATAGIASRGGSCKQAPSPPARLPFGHLGELRRDPFGFLLRCRATHGDIVGLRLFTTKTFLLSHPDHVHHVLQKKQPVYDKDLEPLRRLRPVLGNGMVTADGASWKHQREVARPAFHNREVQAFGPIITDVVAGVVERWRKAAGEQRMLDMHQEMMHVTLRVAGRALFGVDLDEEAERSGALLNATMEAGLKRMNALIAAPMVLPTRNNRILGASRRSLEHLIDRIIDRRRPNAREDEDLLKRLLDDHDAWSPAERSAQFYDEAITILLAGHETTANALSFSLHLLGRHPSVMRTVREETRRVLGGRPALIDDLPKLSYTRMVLDESMRLFPPAWIIDRNSTDDDEIDGFGVPRGSLILISPYVIHRHPAFWPDNERFMPERFAKDRNQDRPRHAYFPFGLGPRVCIGASFALAEAVLVLASLIDRFDVAPAPGHVLTLDPNVTLRPRGGLPMTVRSA